MMNNKKIISCQTCEKLHYVENPYYSDNLVCKRCNSKISFRKPESISRTWCFLIAAIIFYIPANIYPMMYYTEFGKTQADTIISGAEALIQADLWPLALIVFTASIFVPLAKILGLMFLLLTIQFQWRTCPVERTKIYVIVDIIGRWSMLDIFLISLMIALVKLGAIADVTPGPGIRCFTAVVLLTLMAAISFDPRMIWDNEEIINVNNKNTEKTYG